MKTKPQQDNSFLRARRALLLDHCFFGSLIMHLDVVEDPDAQRGIWVDGVNVGFNRESLDKMELPESAGLLAKGVLQCALQHHLRRGRRDEKLWQQASDYVVNPEILDTGLKLPAGALIDRQYQGKSAEQVYEILEQMVQKNKPQDNKKPGEGQGQGSSAGAGQQPQKGDQPGKEQQQKDKQQGKGGKQPQTGEVRDLPGKKLGQAPSEPDRSKQEQEWKINMQQALQNARSRGNLPANFERLIKKELEPRVSWREETRRFMQSLARDDLSWSRPNRRFAWQGLYLPAVHSEKMGTMIVVNDSSGSTQRAQETFFSELKSIIEDVKPERVIYVQQDARIQSIDELEPGDDIVCTMRGGGGTDFRPVFKWVEEQDITPACMVFLTDLDGPFPDEEPPYPVLWAAVGYNPERHKVPFGDVVDVNIAEERI